MKNDTHENDTHALWHIISDIVLNVSSVSFIQMKRLTIRSCYLTVPSAVWEIFSGFLIFCNFFHEPLGELNNSKIREMRKLFVILHEATCDNYFIVKSLLKSHVDVTRVILLTNCIELA